MAEHLAKSREGRFAWVRPLLPLAPFFAALALVILIWGWESEPEEPPAPEPEEPAQTAYLVTAELLGRTGYTDSVLGEMAWQVTDESLAELDRVLGAYGISGAEEVSQFLAQAMVETAGGKWLTELGDEAYFNGYGYTAGTRGAGRPRTPGPDTSTSPLATARWRSPPG